ncbi:DoxX family protein [Pelistega sp. NLN82]|uniref:DoxX family protein n=1 Tax=Pelistega ratti TaxID=2652177 RepID=A0A6L9Y6G1_9BURK|nr:DoxX family protein [Pelistega ratti]NEN76050.1 DoxX family protein [Pelistega ratti]
MDNRLNQYAPYALTLLRLITAYLFIWHGIAKFTEYPMSMTNGHGPVALFSIFGFAGILEIVGSILLALGLFTRPVAFILSGQMAYAYFFIHAANGSIGMPILNSGELAILFSVVFFLFVFTGPGAFALDRK